MRKSVLAAAVAIALVASASASTSGKLVPCGKFIIGKANSTAYSGGKLPAHGSEQGSSCKTLKRIARRLHSGKYPIPKGSGAPAPRYGKVFYIVDRQRQWGCRLQNRGASGPTYAIKCSSSAARLRWHTG